MLAMLNVILIGLAVIAVLQFDSHRSRRTDAEKRDERDRGIILLSSNETADAVKVRNPRGERNRG